MDAPKGTPTSERSGEPRKVLLKGPGRRRAIAWDHPDSVGKWLERDYEVINPDFLDEDDGNVVVISQPKDAVVKADLAKLKAAKAQEE